MLLKGNADHTNTAQRCLPPYETIPRVCTCTRTERRSAGEHPGYLGVVLCELAEGGGEPGVVGSRSDEPQTEDGIVRHLRVSVVRELAAIHKSFVTEPDSISSVDLYPDPNPEGQK
jgi:hypothetical protein